jgi:hypothetical protein
MDETSDESLPAKAASDQLEQAEPSPAAGRRRAEPPTWVLLGGGRSLDAPEANRVAAENGATVVLVAGNLDSGKTTLLVQLWAQFLDGPFAGLRFAGSDTLDAFDERHFGSRVESGNNQEDTDRTQDQDMRFLHLRLADQNGRRDLLLTDLWGELFERVVHGGPVEGLIPIAPRADKAIILVDGAEIADLAQRQVSVANARLLIGSFSQAGGISKDAPMLVALSKSDRLDDLGDQGTAWWDDAAGRLVSEARERGFTNVGSLTLAARPADGGSQRNLDALLSWIWETEPVKPLVEAEAVPSGRVFTTGRFASE